MTKQIIPKEYSELAGIPISSVIHHVRRSVERGEVSKYLPGVKKIERFGRSYVLTVDKKNIKK